MDIYITNDTVLKYEKQPFERPCLIITEKQDTEVGYKDQFELLIHYPNASYCAVNGAGHNLQIEQPIMFENIVSAFLSDR